MTSLSRILALAALGGSITLAPGAFAQATPPAPAADAAASDAAPTPAEAAMPADAPAPADAAAPTDASTPADASAPAAAPDAASAPSAASQPETAASAPASGSETAYTKTVEGSFDDVRFTTEQAITNAGLVIDATSHVGDMLARTKGDVGGAQDLYTAADAFTFCSAAVSRQVMEADITNIQFCPYAIFVYETVAEPGKIVVGHRVYPGETMAPVNDMLSKIVDEAAAQ